MSLTEQKTGASHCFVKAMARDFETRYVDIMAWDLQASTAQISSSR